ncbi:MAG: transcriptional regulator [Rhodospirillaceae bacterium]|nr:transcriptional regulator [Rhodospirillaceae bacterium]
MANSRSISIRPVLGEADYDAALEEVADLMAGDPTEGSTDDIRMSVLATLIEKYEEERYPMEAPGPIEAIRFRMEQSGFERKDLEEILGGPARVSEIFKGRRSLSIAMIRRLNAEWKIPAEILIRDTRKVV